MTDLYRLVYASKNLLTVEGADLSTQVHQILEASRRNNANVDVTGALMFNGSAFAQVLEGPRLGVEATFERIQRDERHGEVTVLQCGPAEARSFTNWSMGFVGQSARGLSLWGRLAAESGFDIARMDGDAVFHMLHDLVLEEEGVTGATGKTEENPTSSQRESDANSTLEKACDSTTEAIVAIVRFALTDEKKRASDIRVEADGLRAELAAAKQQLESMREDRDRWARRARALACCIDAEASSVLASADHASPLKAVA